MNCLSSKNFLVPVCLTLLLIVVSAFAQYGGSGTPTQTTGAAATPSPTSTSTGLPAQSTSRQVFTVALSPSNTDPLFGTASGFGRFVVDGDQFGAYLQLSGLAPGMMHEQHIHAGTQCPDFTADTNGDGFVDAVEGEAVAGPPIVGLALPPTTSGLDSATYPIPSADGVTTYIAGAAFSALGASIASPTPTPTVTPTQLPGASPTASPTVTATFTPIPTQSPATSASQLLSNLEGHVVEIHGVSPDTNLPNTVKSDSGQTATATLPVACGTLVRVQE